MRICKRAGPTPRQRRGDVISYGKAGDTVYAGTADGWVWISFDRGRTFRKTNQSAAFGGPVESLFVDSAERALVAVAGPGARILRTTNGGNFWDDLSQNLPAGAAHAVVADRAAGAVYAATDAGIFYAHTDLVNASPTAPAWRALLGNARGRDVRLDPTGNQLYAAIDGYGVFAATAPASRADGAAGQRRRFQQSARGPRIAGERTRARA